METCFYSGSAKDRSFFWHILCTHYVYLNSQKPGSMKNILFLGLLLTGSAFSFAQPNNVLNAYMLLQEGKLSEAKESIDAATEHPKTAEAAKTWYYRGRIYDAIYVELGKEKHEQIPGIGKLQALLEAARSYRKALKLDVSRIDEQDLKRRYAISANYLLNEGVGEYNDKNYDVAASLFEATIVVQEDFGIVDSLAYYNAALAYENVGNSEKAIDRYLKCADIGYNPTMAYYSAASILREAGKTEEALNILNKAQKEYPDDTNILIAKINILLGMELFDDALFTVDQALVNMPENADLHFTRGTLLEPSDPSEAIRSYERAIAADPNHTNAFYNLGAAYYNQAVKLRNADDATAETGKAELVKARMYLLQVESLSPGIEQVLSSLATINEILGE